MIKTSLYALITLLVFSSCKKDSLEGDREILEGKWEWVYSIKSKVYTNNPLTTSIDTIRPSDVSSFFGLEFLRKGKLHLVENDETIEEYRIVFTSFKNEVNCQSYPFSGEVYYFSIYLNNDEENNVHGCVSADTMTFLAGGFPFPSASGGDPITVYENFFKKVN